MHQPCQLHISSRLFYFCANISPFAYVLDPMPPAFWGYLCKFSLLSALMIKTLFSVWPCPSASGLCHRPWFLLTLPQFSPLLHSQPSAQCSLYPPLPLPICCFFLFVWSHSLSAFCLGYSTKVLRLRPHALLTSKANKHLLFLIWLDLQQQSTQLDMLLFEICLLFVSTYTILS